MLGIIDKANKITKTFVVPLKNKTEIAIIANVIKASIIVIAICCDLTTFLSNSS